MQRSTEHILTTHTGSLPRPAGVPLPGTVAALGGAEATDDADPRRGRRHRAAPGRGGVDVVNDGEMSKPSYATYITSRLTGFESVPSPTVSLPEADEFPEYFERLYRDIASAVSNPSCTGPVAVPRPPRRSIATSRTSRRRRRLGRRPTCS